MDTNDANAVARNPIKTAKGICEELFHFEFWTANPKLTISKSSSKCHVRSGIILSLCITEHVPHPIEKQGPSSPPGSDIPWIGILNLSGGPAHTSSRVHEAASAGQAGQ